MSTINDGYIRERLTNGKQERFVHTITTELIIHYKEVMMERSRGERKKEIIWRT
jgi:hypothetical protein